MQGHQPRKRFGQNFLADAHYVGRIVDAIDPQPGQTIVEIGPGLAALTGALIERAGRIVAIEIDRDLVARLAGRFAPERLQLIEGDALAFDYATLGTELRVVGNLPYNISSPLLFRLAQFTSSLRDLHVMLQKEVVDRMIAAPGTPDYGRLSVMLQSRFAITRLLIVPPGAFRPAPKVDSALARLRPLNERAPAILDTGLFAKIVSAAFSQRRKTLRNALAALCDTATIESAALDPGVRGETLSIDQFVSLANQLAREGGAVSSR